jgi:hypothetical protein
MRKLRGDCSGNACYHSVQKLLSSRLLSKNIKIRIYKREENAGKNHDIKIANRCSENVAQFRYLGTTVTNQYMIQEGIKRRLNAGNACYPVPNLLSSCLMLKEGKIRIYKTIILPVVLYGCKTWSLTSREGHRLRVFENRVLRRIFEPKRDEDIGGWKKLHNEKLYNLYSSPSIIRMIKSRRMQWAGHVA